MEVPDTVGEGVVNLELAFERKLLPCLRWASRDVQNQEQTLEVRLPDGMPDIGSILGAWGQCILRGKEWRGEEAGVSGGVMVWVVYQPVDDSGPQCLEGWIPMQQKWKVKDCQREGVIRSQWNLKGVDARTLSGRKMMLRAAVGILAELLEPMEAQLYTPGELPEDIELLRWEYPTVIPREAGEKTFQLEEELPLPDNAAPAAQLLYCQAVPVVTEQKITGGKAVFRGALRCHLLYREENGTVHSTDLETGFAQFEDLEEDYPEDTSLSVLMDMTGFEPELREGVLFLKGSMTAQYLILAKTMLELVEDAYSPLRSMTLRTESVDVPSVLDSNRRILEAGVPAPEGRVVDAAVSQEHPVVRRAGELTEIEFPGTVQVLRYDDQGTLKGEVLHWKEHWELPADTGVLIYAEAGPADISAVGSRIDLSLEAKVDAVSPKMSEAVMSLELGDRLPPDPERPSLILRRAGDKTLWELAKSCGSTVDAIRSANGLTQDPPEERMLLIPVT